MLLPSLSLARRELVRFWRQPHRVIGALGTPVVFWLLLGAGFGRSLNVGDGSSYITFFFPGTLLMILLFTAIFSTISVIEDRREGFLQSVLVAPISPGAIVLGKVLGGTALAAGQGAGFLLLGPLVGIWLSPGQVLATLGVMALTAFGLTALGFAIAWRMNSTQGFHAVMNLFLMPLWFLSGAIFPPGGAWTPLRWAVAANPLSYGLSALRQAMGLSAAPAPDGEPFGSVPFVANVAVALAATAFVFALARFVARRATPGDLQ